MGGFEEATYFGTYRGVSVVGGAVAHGDFVQDGYCADIHVVTVYWETVVWK